MKQGKQLFGVILNVFLVSRPQRQWGPHLVKYRLYIPRLFAHSANSTGEAWWCAVGAAKYGENAQCGAPTFALDTMAKATMQT